VAIALDLGETGVAVLRFENENDSYDAGKLRDLLGEAAADGRAILVDLSRATFVDSTIVAAIIEGLRDSEATGRRFSIFLPADSGEYVRRLFSITGLDQVLPFTSAWDTALAALRTPDD
jgi:anti-sigma B factor antagonist